MKFHLSLLGILLVVLVGLAYFTITFNEQQLLSFHGSDQDVRGYLTSYRQHHKPLLEINFSTLYGSSGQFEVLHPLLDMRRVKVAEPTCRGTERAERPACRLGALHLDDSPLEENFSTGYESKRIAIEHFFREGIKLPDSFLTNPPFVDISGTSYALLLEQSAIAPYGRKEWVEQYLSFFKTSELKEILYKYQIGSPEFSVISRLTDSELEEIVRGTPFVMTQDYLLFKNEPRLGFSPLSYWVFDIRELRADLGNGKYELNPYVPGAVCLQRTGNVCWTYSSRHALGYVYRYSVAVLISIGLIFFILLCIYVKYLYLKSREQVRHRLSLQVLSHEFRTPISSMLLLLDQLSKSQTRFDIADQDLITRVSSEVFRLQRIVEVSKTYLQAESSRIPFNYVEIPSVNNWISDFIADTNPHIRCEPLPVDQNVKADPFWLRFVLSSLVQNAFAHGKEPVTIKLKNHQGRLLITVEDEGECEFKSLHQMSDAFVKSPRSKGMGLGLNIVKFIVDEWHSEIRFSKYPTAFTLALTGK